MKCRQDFANNVRSCFILERIGEIDYARGAEVKLATLRACWAFVAFVPFAWLWGIESSLLFCVISTLYMIPVHMIFDGGIKWLNEQLKK